MMNISPLDFPWHHPVVGGYLTTEDLAYVRLYLAGCHDDEDEVRRLMLMVVDDIGENLEEIL
jgi:hypothetical protein